MGLRHFFTLFFLVAAFAGFGQVLKPVKWEITTEKVKDNTYYLVFKAKITKGWTVYSQYTSDEGPVPTAITYEEKGGIKLVGKATEKGYKKKGRTPCLKMSMWLSFWIKSPL
ncbi:MAG: hypothetical protein IPP37_16470 [Saprospiraceae bacterium]|nr:hypothetical protein [Saprospiraceae bacterium]